ncbi:MAG: NAD(P)/FAD-dependent oxidoreductase [Lachnospiraceae bacterium]|jgi:nitrite reductase (NADH) large subunit|nr:NAD(P)/FAD-dependent oxidoreductase [Lachnospiraceae bacterium]
MAEIYVIVGTGAAGMAAAERIRLYKKDATVIMMSIDEHSHSRCMLHKFLGGERTEEELSFVEPDFFEKNEIHWGKAQKALGLDIQNKRIQMENGYQPYDKLLIATGSVFGIPPINHFRTASNVYGFRDLSDAQKIDAAVKAKNAKHVFIVGSGLVGLDVATGLMERGVKVTIAEMAPRVMPLQTDDIAAKAYQERFEAHGARFLLGIGASDSIINDQNEITAVVLSTGETVACDFVICAAGVRPNIAWLEGSGLETERGIKVDSHMRTSAPDVYAAGDVTALAGVWPNAMDMGRVAASNMCGVDTEYTDRYCMKNTSNFFGLQMLTIGDINAQVEGADIYVKESRNCYKKAIVKDGVLKSVLIQGDISHTGHWQYLIKNEINLSEILKRKEIFDITYGDFFETDDIGEYQYKN